MPVKAVEEGSTYIQRGARIKRIVKIMGQHRQWVADEDSHRDAEQDADPGIYPGFLLADAARTAQDSCCPLIGSA